VTTIFVEARQRDNDTEVQVDVIDREIIDIKKQNPEASH
jgi:hypothetical protein